MEEKISVMFSEKYDHNVLTHFIIDRDYCVKADSFIKTTLSASYPLPHEIPCACLFWKTRELPISEIKGNNVDTTRGLIIDEGKGLVEFVFNSTKYHYSICRLNSIHRIERTDYSLIVVTQNAVVPCAIAAGAKPGGLPEYCCNPIVPVKLLLEPRYRVTPYMIINQPPLRCTELY